MKKLTRQLVLMAILLFTGQSLKAQCTDPLKYADSCDYDGDGVINIIDLDDDNDGILDCTEAYSGGVYLTDPFTTVPLDLYPNSLVQYTGDIVAGDSAAVHNVASDADGNFGLATRTNAGFSYQFNTNLPVDLKVEPYTANVAGVFTTNDRITFSSDVPITLNNPVGHLEISTDGGSTWSTPSTYTATSILFRPIGGIAAIGVANFDFTMTGATSFTYAMASTGGNPNGSTFRMLVGDCSDIDTDGDGIPDRFDLDSDNDGCLDALEGSAGLTYDDLDGFALTGPVDANGVPTIAAGGQTIGTSNDEAVVSVECDPCNSSSSQFMDTDGDGLGNACDLDSDGDGILDSVEQPACYQRGDIAMVQQGTNLVAFNLETGQADSVTSVLNVDLGTYNSSARVDFNGIGYNKELNIVYGTSSRGTGTYPSYQDEALVYYDVNNDTWGVIIEDFFVDYGTFIQSGAGAFYDGVYYMGNTGDDIYAVHLAEDGITLDTVTHFADNPFNIPVQVGDWGDLAIGGGCNGEPTLFMHIGNHGLWGIDLSTATDTGNVGTPIIPKTGGGAQIGDIGSLDDGTLIMNYGTDIYAIDVCNGQRGPYLGSLAAGIPDIGSSILSPACDSLNDIDGDGIPNYLDTDSDNDGCPDALEGGGDIQKADLDTSDMITGGSDANGVPTAVGSAGQSIGSSTDSLVISQSCVVADTVIYAISLDSSNSLKVCPTADDIRDPNAMIQYSSCADSTSLFNGIIDANGCLDMSLIIALNTDSAYTDSVTSCIVACDSNICDTTYIQLSVSHPGPLKVSDINIQHLGCNNKITWTTYEEKYLDRAEIYRSPNASELGDKVAEVALVGNTNKEVDYSVIDENGATSPAYYRVKFIEITGIATYSQPVFIDAARCTLDRDQINIYPNPNNGDFDINIEVKKTATYSVEVLDIISRVVYRKDVDFFAGDNTLKINAGIKVDGVYQVILKDNFGKILSIEKIVVKH